MSWSVITTLIGACILGGVSGAVVASIKIRRARMSLTTVVRIPDMGLQRLFERVDALETGKVLLEGESAWSDRKMETRSLG